MSDEREVLQEIHGLSDLRRCVRNGADVSQEVLIKDRDGAVHIELQHTSYGAVLTPAGARYLAKQIEAAAARAERSGKQ